MPRCSPDLGRSIDIIPDIQTPLLATQEVATIQKVAGYACQILLLPAGFMMLLAGSLPSSQSPPLLLIGGGTALLGIVGRRVFCKGPVSYSQKIEEMGAACFTVAGVVLSFFPPPLPVFRNLGFVSSILAPFAYALSYCDPVNRFT